MENDRDEQKWEGCDRWQINQENQNLHRHTRRRHTHRHTRASRATSTRWLRDYRGAVRRRVSIGTPDDVIPIDATGVTVAMGAISNWGSWAVPGESRCSKWLRRHWRCNNENRGLSRQAPNVVDTELNPPIRIGDMASGTSDRFVTINVLLIPERLDCLEVEVRGCLLSDRLSYDSSPLWGSPAPEPAASVVTERAIPPICFCTWNRLN